MSITEKSNPSNDFLKAQSCIRRYAWTLGQWSLDSDNTVDEDDRYSDDALLSVMVLWRSAAKRYFDMIKNSTPVTDSDLSALQSEFNQAEETFSSMLQDKGSRVRLRNTIAQIEEETIAEVQENLDAVIAISRDAELFDDDDSFREEFLEMAGEFLTPFDSIRSLADIWNELGEIGKDSKLPDRFRQIEKRFRGAFYHFVPATSYLKGVGENIFATGNDWWYTIPPDPYRRFLARYFSEFESLGETEKSDLLNHLANCTDCWQEWHGLKKLRTSLRTQMRKALPTLGEIWSWLQERFPVQPYISYNRAYAAGYASAGRREDSLKTLKTWYAVPLKRDPEGKIIIVDEKNEYRKNPPLKTLSTVLHGSTFHYKAISSPAEQDASQQLREIASGTCESCYLPFCIVCTEEVTSLLVLISQNEEALDRAVSEIGSMTGDEKAGPVPGVIYIFVGVKQTDEQ